MKIKNIMVVEDENIIAMDIKFRLKSLGYNIPAVVPSGEEAIETAGRLKPDLILMDILLRGEMDGVEAAEYILKENHIPVIFLTSFSDAQTLKLAHDASPFGYLIKPLNEDELKSKLDAMKLN
ncbi:MAG TPA: response regulator [Ignavibacteriaceae bacterium]|nr:response regulator [Ignavibacteriaceae bacterium]